MFFHGCIWYWLIWNATKTFSIKKCMRHLPTGFVFFNCFFVIWLTLLTLMECIRKLTGWSWLVKNQPKKLFWTNCYNVKNVYELNDQHLFICISILCAIYVEFQGEDKQNRYIHTIVCVYVWKRQRKRVPKKPNKLFKVNQFWYWTI